MTVTPDMLLFLAEKMGLQCARILYDDVFYREGWTGKFRPHKDNATFGRLLFWATMKGIRLNFNNISVIADINSTDVYSYMNETESHDGSDDGIRAAVDAVIANVLGYHEGKE